jgi:hypothetical protein
MLAFTSLKSLLKEVRMAPLVLHMLMLQFGQVNFDSSTVMGCPPYDAIILTCNLIPELFS